MSLYTFGTLLSENSLRKRKHVKSTYTDIWGYEYDWFSLEDGWTKFRRENMSSIENWVKNQMEIIPKFTRTGYKKMRMPQKMHKMILKARQVDNFTYPDCEPNWPMHNCQRITKEGKIGKFVHCTSKWLDLNHYIFPVPEYNMMNLNVQFDKNNLGDYISTYVKNEIEEWCGQELDKKIIFHGIRRFLKGAWMALHLDKLPTHIISAILQVFE